MVPRASIKRQRLPIADLGEISFGSYIQTFLVSRIYFLIFRFSKADRCNFYVS